MNYDGLQAAYWQTEIKRVEELRERIHATTKTTLGRVVPDDDALVIGREGRRLNMAVMFIDT